MPRPKKPRFVSRGPSFSSFRPHVQGCRETGLEVLTVEELEALRLADVEGLYQEEAAERMEVSRQTFQRILKSARKKVASSLVIGKAIEIEGGCHVIAGDKRILECVYCGHKWIEPFGTGKRACEYSCPRCGKQTVRRSHHESGIARGWMCRYGHDLESVENSSSYKEEKRE